MKKIIFCLCFVLMALMAIASVSACDTNNITINDNNLEGNDISIPFVQHTAPDTGGSIYSNGSNVNNCSHTEQSIGVEIIRYDIHIKKLENKINELISDYENNGLINVSLGNIGILPLRMSYSIAPIIVHENETGRDVYYLKVTLIKTSWVKEFTLNLNISGVNERQVTCDMGMCFDNINGLLFRIGYDDEFNDVIVRTTYLIIGDVSHCFSEVSFEKADFKQIDFTL